MKYRLPALIGLVVATLLLGGCKLPSWISGEQPATVDPVATCAGFQDIPATRNAKEFVKATLDGVRACIPTDSKGTSATQATPCDGTTCTLEDWWDAPRATIGPGHTDFLIVYCPEQKHIVFSEQGIGELMQKPNGLYDVSRLIMWAYYAGVAAAHGKYNDAEWRAALEGVVAECLWRDQVLPAWRLPDLRDRGQYLSNVYQRARDEAASRCKAT